MEAQLSPRRIKAEVIIVLGLSLGWSAVRAVFILIERYLAEAPLGEQTAQLNPSASKIDYLDFAYQLIRPFAIVMPALLAVYLLAGSLRAATRRLGLFWSGEGSRSWLYDLAVGAGLAGLVGLPGLVWVGIGRALGITTNIDTSGLPDAWWAALTLVLGALATGVLEETVVVGYLVTRLRELAWSPVAVIAASAILRGLYHAYQGPGMMLGNAAMGALFAWWFTRGGRLAPLIVAHAIIDVVSFVGPDVVPAEWLAALGLV